MYLLLGLDSKAAMRSQLSPVHCLVGDIETLPLPGKFDLIISASTFQWFACPEKTYTRLSEHLFPGGWMVFSTFGENNFRELKILTGSGLTYQSLKEITVLLERDLEVLHAEEELYTLEFEDPLEVLQHVKKTGVNATSVSRQWTRGRLIDFSQEYKARFLVDGQCPLTYHPLYLICRK